MLSASVLLHSTQVPENRTALVTLFFTPLQEAESYSLQEAISSERTPPSGPKVVLSVTQHSYTQ